MSSNPAHARKEQQIQKAKAHKAEARQSVTDEQKERIREMRKLGFAPRKGNVTQKHFERYAAYLETQAMATGLYIERNPTDTASDMVIQFYGGGGGSCPAMQFRVAYKNGGISYRSARDSYGFEGGFIELATAPALAKLKAEIYRDLTAAGVKVPEIP